MVSLVYLKLIPLLELILLELKSGRLEDVSCMFLMGLTYICLACMAADAVAAIVEHFHPKTNLRQAEHTHLALEVTGLGYAVRSSVAFKSCIRSCCSKVPSPCQAENAPNRWERPACGLPKDGRATNTTSFQISIRIFFLPPKIRNMF